MVMVEGSLIVFGVMISYWIDLGFSFLEPSSIAWRFPIAFQIILAVFILIAIPGLPESPRWLILKGRDEDALDVLAALSDLPREDKKIQSEFLAVKDVVFEMSKGGFRECFKFNRNRNFHRTVLAYVNQMFQQVSSVHCFSTNPPAHNNIDLWHQSRYVLRRHYFRDQHRSLALPQSTSICL
jgi:MFS family permease